jgi:Domain of unknown function (DUF4232)
MIVSSSRTSTPTQPGTPRFRRRRLVLVLGVTVLLGSACSSAKDSAAPATSTPPSSSTATLPPTASSSSVPVPASSSQTTAARSSAAATPSRSPATVTPSAPTPTAPVTTDGCQAAALDVQALRGSGAAGHEYAFLQFTNKSAKTCTLTGFPGVELRKAGAPLGKPATRSDKIVATVKLAPGTSATARLVDASTCQADKSDSVQIIPPNLTVKYLRPLSLRGCALTIDPVVAG